MGSVTESIKDILKKCTIEIGGDEFSNESIIKAYVDFLISTYNTKSHNVGIVLHTGSICFDAASMALSACICLISNETDTDDVISSFDEGDMVLYGEKKKERFLFSRRIEDGAELGGDHKGKRYIELKQSDNILYVPEKRWRFIEPYKGNSKRLDGRGIRKKKSERDLFFDMLGYKKEDIPSVIDRSAVLVMSRDRADHLYREIGFRIDKKIVKLSDIVTASYYTEEGDYPLGANSSKSEPVLKICAKTSVARDMVYSNSGNKVSGIMLFGQDIIQRGETEIPELMNRRSLGYVYLCAPIEYEFASNMLEENEDINLFACTKDLLTLNTKDTNVDALNPTVTSLRNRISKTVNKSVSKIVLEGFPISNEEYVEVRRSLRKIKRYEYDSEAKDSFLILAYSLLNLFNTCIFSIELLDSLSQSEVISVLSVSEKLKQLKEYRDQLPENLQPDVQTIMAALDKISYAFWADAPKGDWLKSFYRSHKGERIAVIVPKAYYAEIMRRSGTVMSLEYTGKIQYFTAGRFDYSQEFDHILVIGFVEGKCFNPFSCNASFDIRIVMYENERCMVRAAEKKEREKNNNLDRRQNFEIKGDEEFVDGAEEENEAVEIEEELEHYIEEASFAFESSYMSRITDGSRYSLDTEIVAIAIFTDGSKAFLSKNYKPYVFDELGGEAKEVTVSDLVEGDRIIFTKNNDDTKDIVDAILRKCILDGKLSESAVDYYEKSKEWRQELIGYMQRNDLSARNVANRLSELGLNVTEMAVLRWLDEDAHIVGPREVASLRIIGELTGHAELKDNPELFYNACKEVRHIRRRILNQVGQSIIRNLTGRENVGQNDFSLIEERIKSLAEICQIERISRVSKQVPMNIANRPLNV